MLQPDLFKDPDRTDVLGVYDREERLHSECPPSVGRRRGHRLDPVPLPLESFKESEPKVWVVEERPLEEPRHPDRGAILDQFDGPAAKSMFGEIGRAHV